MRVSKSIALIWLTAMAAPAAAGSSGSASIAEPKANAAGHQYPGHTTTARLTEPTSSYQRIFGPAQPPYGFVQFCDENPAECVSGPLEQSRFNATPARLSELDEVNRHVNRTIQPITDLEHYGVTEYWSLPNDGKGDCEDYALLKRHELIKRGWPVSSLLMTVVRDEKGEGHAVLTARTQQGDFVLDNKAEEVKLWYQTPYEFVMRQSYLNARAWISLDPTDTTAPVAIAGVKPPKR